MVSDRAGLGSPRGGRRDVLGVATRDRTGAD